MKNYDEFMLKYEVYPNCKCPYCKNSLNIIDNYNIKEQHQYFYYSDYWLYEKFSKNYYSKYRNCKWELSHCNSRDEIYIKSKFSMFFHDLISKIDKTIPFGIYHNIYMESTSQDDYVLNDYYEKGNGYILKLDIKKLVDLLDENNIKW